MIISIESITKKDDYFIVDAVIDGAIVESPMTYMDPPEYGPALCRASVSCLEETEITVDILEELDIDWIPICGD
jgi:hypothetical protein